MLKIYVKCLSLLCLPYVCGMQAAVAPYQSARSPETESLRDVLQNRPSFFQTYRWPILAGAGGAVFAAGKALRDTDDLAPYMLIGGGSLASALILKTGLDSLKQKREFPIYQATLLSALGGWGLGHVLAKIMQDRGWNPYLVAAGAGALCGAGMQRLFAPQKNIEIQEIPQKDQQKMPKRAASLVLGNSSKRGDLHPLVQGSQCFKENLNVEQKNAALLLLFGDKMFFAVGQRSRVLWDALSIDDKRTYLDKLIAPLILKNSVKYAGFMSNIKDATDDEKIRDIVYQIYRAEDMRQEKKQLVGVLFEGLEKNLRESSNMQSSEDMHKKNKLDTIRLLFTHIYELQRPSDYQKLIQKVGETNDLEDLWDLYNYERNIRSNLDEQKNDDWVI